jgi:hypothetical protein
MSTLRTDTITTVAGKPLVNNTGNVINVYQTVDTTQDFFQDGLVDSDLTGLSITLTPTSTNSKFILVANIVTTTNFVLGFGFKRNGTRIGKATANINAGLAAGGTNFTYIYYEGSSYGVQMAKTIMDYDLPNTVSNVTYTPFFRNTWDSTNYGTYYNNRSNNDMGSTSSFIIYEVVG